MGGLPVGKVIGVTDGEFNSGDIVFLIEEVFNVCEEVLNECEVISEEKVVGKGEGLFKEVNLNILGVPKDVILKLGGAVEMNEVDVVSNNVDLMLKRVGSE